MKTALKQMSTLLFSSLSVFSEEVRPPNIVLIMADDMGYECVGVNGGTSYATPNIDRLAEEGMRFEHCYSSPACTPSRVKIMTGRYNVYNYTRFAQLRRGENTFAHLLAQAGYTTCIAGKWQLGQTRDAPQHFGFQQSLLWQHTRSNFSNATQTDTRYANPQLERNGVEENYAKGEFGPDLITDFIGTFIETHKEKPFLIYYPMLLPHSPFVPNPDSQDWNPNSPGAKRGSMDPFYFDDMVRYTDKMVGRVIDQLERAGVADNTYVFFTTDNGSLGNTISKINGRAVRGGKGQTTDAGTHVPLVVRGPKVPPGVVNGDLIDFSDFLPTFCEIAGISLNSDHQKNGASFLPQLRGEFGTPREFIYCWYKIPKFMEKQFGGISDISFVRNHRYKLYRDGNFYDLQRDNLENKPLPQEAIKDELARTKLRLKTVIQEHDVARVQ
ncbi:MAG: Arylsulfatase [Opitutia bacterium UBA7350]|nr:MAG: Arylsulfatase [Opitutae bacterium UBA7350]